MYSPIGVFSYGFNAFALIFMYLNRKKSSQTAPVVHNAESMPKLLPALIYRDSAL